jgi:hypothetical protein
VKKLLLIPTVVLTAFLALAFLMPATAAHVIRSVAPVAQISLAFGNSAANENAAAPASNAGTAGSAALSAGSSSTRASSPSGSSTSAQDSASQLLISSQTGHDVATGGETNCGRFGNGHHGGKHDFICPNRPFPQPATP